MADDKYEVKGNPIFAEAGPPERCFFPKTVTVDRILCPTCDQGTLVRRSKTLWTCATCGWQETR